MSATADRQGKGWRRWRRAATVFAVALVGGLGAVVPAGTASAANTICVNYPGSSYTLSFDNPYTAFDPSTQQDRQYRFFFPDGHDHAHVKLTYWIHSVTPTFNVASSAFVDNGTNDTISGLFSTSHSETFSITESVSTGVTSTFQSTAFSSTVSTSVTGSITTSTTITATGPVPPHSRVNADFGVDAYIVNYDVDFWQWDQGSCWYHGSNRNVTANVPTTRQGWHLYPAQPL